MTDGLRRSVDHSFLSPSGRVSKRSREAALKRTAAELFPPGYWDREKSDNEKRKEEIESLRQAAAGLRDLASRGIRSRKYTAEAERLDAEAAAIEAKGSA